MRLRLTQPGQEPVVFESERDAITIGRSPDCDLTLGAAYVSNRHLMIVRGLVAIDLGSRNGTWVDGRRIELPTILEHGRVSVGNEELVVEVQGDIAATAGDEPTIGPEPGRAANAGADAGMDATHGIDAGVEEAAAQALLVAERAAREGAEAERDRAQVEKLELERRLAALKADALEDAGEAGSELAARLARDEATALAARNAALERELEALRSTVETQRGELDEQREELGRLRASASEATPDSSGPSDAAVGDPGARPGAPAAAGTVEAAESPADSAAAPDANAPAGGDAPAPPPLASLGVIPRPAVGRDAALPPGHEPSASGALPPEGAGTTRPPSLESLLGRPGAPASGAAAEPTPAVPAPPGPSTREPAPPERTGAPAANRSADETVPPPAGGETGAAPPPPADFTRAPRAGGAPRVPVSAPGADPASALAAELLDALGTSVTAIEASSDAAPEEFLSLANLRFVLHVERFVTRIAGESIELLNPVTMLPDTEDNYRGRASAVLEDPHDPHVRRELDEYLEKLAKWLVVSLRAIQQSATLFAEDLKSELSEHKLAQKGPLPRIPMFPHRAEAELWKRACEFLRELTPDLIDDRLERITRQSVQELLESDASAT